MDGDDEDVEDKLKHPDSAALDDTGSASASTTTWKPDHKLHGYGDYYQPEISHHIHKSGEQA